MPWGVWGEVKEKEDGRSDGGKQVGLDRVSGWDTRKWRGAHQEWKCSVYNCRLKPYTYIHIYIYLGNNQLRGEREWKEEGDGHSPISAGSPQASTIPALWSHPGERRSEILELPPLNTNGAAIISSLSHTHTHTPATEEEKAQTAHRVKSGVVV